MTEPTTTAFPEQRDGEDRLSFDPLERVDAQLRFIGHIETPWPVPYNHLTLPTREPG